jgi:hypothetical protein
MVTKVEDFTGSHYMYNRDRAMDRFERYLKAIDMKTTPTLSTQRHVQFLVAPANYFSNYQEAIILSIGGSMANQRYLGWCHELFDDKHERLVSTWPAFSWILEDYGMSTTEPIVADLVYKRMSIPWSFKPPPAVQVHYHFCPCEKKTQMGPECNRSLYGV